MSILDQLFGTMNVIFGVVMLVLFGFSIVRMRKNPKENTTIPNLIAALGIIGTFAGIFSGLLGFDTDKLDASIPKLLDGMKTAFLTSLIGLVLSNILKCFQSSKVKLAVKNDKNNVGEVSLEKIATLMNEMKNAIVDSNKEVVGAIKDIKENSEKTSDLNKIGMESLVEELTGNKETSLVGQMKVLRESMVEAQEKAQERLNSGLEKMGEQLGSLVETNNAISTEIERGNDVLI
ncbi:MAG: MotA/TolQ/ExbB proton channel family protein, partial [Cetobacterium sp.]